MLGLDLNLTPGFKASNQVEKMVYGSLSEELDDIIEMHKNLERPKYKSKNPSEIFLKLPKIVRDSSVVKEDTIETVLLNLRGFNYDEKRPIALSVNSKRRSEELVDVILKNLMPDDADEEDFITSNFVFYIGAIQSLENAKILNDDYLKSLSFSNYSLELTVVSKNEKKLNVKIDQERGKRQKVQNAAETETCEVEKEGARFELEDYNKIRYKIKIERGKQFFDVLDLVKSMNYSAEIDYSHCSVYTTSFIKNQNRVKEYQNLTSDGLLPKYFILKNHYKTSPIKLNVIYMGDPKVFRLTNDMTIKALIYECCYRFSSDQTYNFGVSNRSSIITETDDYGLNPKFFYLCYLKDVNQHCLNLQKTLKDLCSLNLRIVQKQFNDELNTFSITPPYNISMAKSLKIVAPNKSISGISKSHIILNIPNSSKKKIFDVKKITTLGRKSLDYSLTIEEIMGEKTISIQKRNKPTLLFNLREIESINRKSKKAVMLVLNGKKYYFECQNDKDADMLMDCCYGIK